LRIAIVTSSYPLKEIDGQAAAGLFVRDFAAAVASQGHEVHVVTQNKGNGCSFSPKGVTVHCFDWLGGDRTLSSLKVSHIKDVRAANSYLASGKRKLCQLHNETPIDHVLAMWAVPGGLLARALCKRCGVPYSVWCLGSDIWTYGKIPILKSRVAGVLRSASFRYADGLVPAVVHQHSSSFKNAISNGVCLRRHGGKLVDRSASTIAISHRRHRSLCRPEIRSWLAGWCWLWWSM